MFDEHHRLGRPLRHFAAYPSIAEASTLIQPGNIIPLPATEEVATQGQSVGRNVQPVQGLLVVVVGGAARLGNSSAAAGES